MAVDPISGVTGGGILLLLAREAIKIIAERKNNKNAEITEIKVQLGRTDVKIDSLKEYTKEQFNRIFKVLNRGS